MNFIIQVYSEFQDNGILIIEYFFNLKNSHGYVLIIKGMTEKSETKLMFAPFSSQISPTFWAKYDEIKLEVLKLNDEPVQISGVYSPHDIPDLAPILSVDNHSFQENAKAPYASVKVPGILKSTLSLEQFKQIDYNILMQNFGKLLLKDLFTKEGLHRIAINPSVLGSFFILTYADLKKYKFLFWFGFPAATLPFLETLQVGSCVEVSAVFEDFENFQKIIHSSHDIVDKGFFIIERNPKDFSVIIRSLIDIEKVYLKKILENVWFAFLDTSSVINTPSWVLRNYLIFIYKSLNLSPGTTVNIFSYRPGRTQQHDKSFTFKVLYNKVEDVTDTMECCKFIGWERNDKGTFGPKHLDAQMTMAPKKLAENSVDFNLKLMKWRLFPDFNLEMMHQTRCLVIGAGTLGCNVARCLMGWGIRKIKFLDNGRVSYSNPVRQSLFNFDDCGSGGKEKAIAAAENLKQIFPGMETEGVNIMVPMPGHPTSQGTIDQVRKDYEILVKSVEECDVMFLLMDTRESRWLPTVLGAKNRKIVINAALGFDSYLVMRHGVRDDNNQHNMGCYYCTDVVAPGDSTKDRTLDQQCTITRPGVSMIAAALAVELMTSILHHPLRGLAHADSDDKESPLGFIPHSIRGFLSSGEKISPRFPSYEKCTACSNKVLSELETRGFEFVSDVLNSSHEYLEKLTGLDEMKECGDLNSEIIELSDEDD